MAKVSDDPTRLSGSTWYLLAVSSGNQLNNRGINFKIGKVDGGHAILPGKDRRHFIVVQVAQLDQRVTEPSPIGLLMFKRQLKLVRGDQVLLEQYLAELTRHSRISPLSRAGLHARDDPADLFEPWQFTYTRQLVKDAMEFRLGCQGDSPDSQAVWAPLSS